MELRAVTFGRHIGVQGTQHTSTGLTKHSHYARTSLCRSSAAAGAENLCNASSEIQAGSSAQVLSDDTSACEAHNPRAQD